MAKQSSGHTRLITGIFLGSLLLLGVADALTVERDFLDEFPSLAQNSDSSSSTTMSTGASQSSVASATSQRSAGGVAKREGPNVLEVLEALQITPQDTKETSLVQQIIPGDVATVESYALLEGGDRAGLIAWVDSPQVKVYFIALKEALHSTFSPQMRDLVDETQEREGKPPRSLLTFRDPAISEERIVFVRVRERLYELHVPEGRDELIFDLVETLTN